MYVLQYGCCTSSVLLFFFLCIGCVRCAAQPDKFTQPYLHWLQAANDNNLQLSDDMMDEALLHIEKQLSQHHKSLSLFPGMPLPTVRNAMSSTEAAERAYDPEMLAASVAANMPLLNPEQKDVYDAVMQAVAASADAKVQSK